MGLLDRFRESGDETDEEEHTDVIELEREDHGPAFALAVEEADLDALGELLDREQSTPTPMEEDPMFDRTADEMIDDALEDMGIDAPKTDDPAPALEDALGVWRDQMSGDPSSIWWSFGASVQLTSFLQRCEVRDEIEEDAFEFPESADRVKSLLERGRAIEHTSSKLAIVERQHLPFEGLNDE